MMAMKRVGVVRSGTYIYLIPVVTMLGAVAFIAEPIHPLQVGGALLTMAGLFISQWRKKQPKPHIEETTLHGG